jgi:hypothetical protein
LRAPSREISPARVPRPSSAAKDKTSSMAPNLASAEGLAWTCWRP